MSRIRFIVCVLIALSLVFLFNLGYLFIHKGVAGYYVNKVRSAQKIDILFIGNSTTMKGIDTGTFVSYFGNAGNPLAAVNGGMSSASPVEQLIIMRQAYQTHHSIKLLVVGFFDDSDQHSLTDAPIAFWGKFQENDLWYLYDPELAAALYFPNSMCDRVFFRMAGYIPMYFDRASIWTYAKKWRMSLSHLGVRSIQAQEFSRPPIYSDEPDYQESTTETLNLSIPVMDMIALAEADHSKVIFVRVPLSSSFRHEVNSSKEYHHYLAVLKNTLNEMGVTLIDASRWIPDDYFAPDGFHLNDDKGGRFLFTQKLAAAIPRTNL